MKTQIELVPFCFQSDWAVRAVFKIYAILLKYPTFVSKIFSIKYKIRLPFSVVFTLKSEKPIIIKAIIKCSCQSI